MTQEQKRAINTLRASNENKEYVATLLENGQAQIIYFDINPLEKMVDCQWLADTLNLALNKDKFTAADIITEHQRKIFFL